MPERLGLGLIQIDPQRGAGWRAGEIQEIARAAEDAGFEAVFCAEVNNDAIASTALTIAGSAPTVPASPAPLAPSGLRLVGTGLEKISMCGIVSARGME